MALSYKQQRFIDEYMIDFNGTQAAIRAGYSPRTAGSQAYQLVRDERGKMPRDLAAGIRQQRGLSI